jgi:hypothetical protein
MAKGKISGQRLKKHATHGSEVGGAHGTAIEDAIDLEEGLSNDHEAKDDENHNLEEE